MAEKEDSLRVWRELLKTKTWEEAKKILEKECPNASAEDIEAARKAYGDEANE